MNHNDTKRSALILRHVYTVAYLFLFTLLVACGSNPINSQPTKQPPPTIEFTIATSAPTHTLEALTDTVSTPTATPVSNPTIEKAIETPPSPKNETTEVPTEESPPETPSEAVPSPTPALGVTCTDIDSNWGQDWGAVLNVLSQLIATNTSCGDEPLVNKKYAAHFSYAASLESSGDVTGATKQYQAALLLDPQRNEATEALIRLNALPEPTPPTCQSTSPPRPDPAPAGVPDLSQFVTVQGDQLYLNGQVFKVKGVNYYPRHAPWHRFLEEAQPPEMATELDLIKQAGFNTIRIFLRYEPLFTCRPEDAIPNEATFTKIDTLFELAQERNLKLIVTLNDLPDLVFRPLYQDWAHYDAQTTYIVRRYRNNSNILAWDLRNEGDLDYGARPGDDARFTQEEVLMWLSHISQLVRDNDPHHLLTAGWWGDPTPTSSYVDILSFHHWSEAEELRARINDYRQRNVKPLMLQEVGYHSWADALHDQRDLFGQADILGRVTNVVEAEGISGWVIWTAFDFVLEPGQPQNFEHYFGLWQTDLTPKPALDVLPLQ